MPIRLVCLTLFLCGCSTSPRAFDVGRFGAAGDARVNDAPAIQKAIDACSAAGGGRVVLASGKTYRAGTITLKTNVTLHLEKGATLLASDCRDDYRQPVLIESERASGIAIDGEGTIDGQSRRFMKEELPHIFRPKPFRPAMVRWTSCRFVSLRGIAIKDAPQWTVHLAGCEQVRIEAVKILNDMKVPNCDGIDVDHSRDVEIRDCTIRSGDDCIVLKTTRKHADLGPCENVRIFNCNLQSSSCAIKLGSETVSAIRNCTFDSCTITDSNRGLGVQQRDEGDIENITFSNMAVGTRLRHDEWWGKAEPIYVTALPRNQKTKLGRMKDVRFAGVRCTGENGAYIAGCQQSRPEGILLDNVTIRLEKLTPWPGGRYDRRPTTGEGIAQRRTAGIYCEDAASLTIHNCRILWPANPPPTFGPALEIHRVGKLILTDFHGTAAHSGDADRIVD